MIQQLPIRINPKRLAEQQSQLSGHYALQDLKRLIPLLEETSGQVRFELSFRQDDKKRTIVQTAVHSQLIVVCQRCLQSMPLMIEQQSELAVVQGLQEAERLPTALDPLLLAEDELLFIRDLIEDELLLALPAVPKHEDCSLPLPAVDEVQAAANNPFSVLAQLKRKN